jgi:hypothetical protein
MWYPVIKLSTSSVGAATDVGSLYAVSGGWSIDFGLFKVTGRDVANAAKWVWNHA